jgi:hypothetical protein
LTSIVNSLRKTCRVVVRFFAQFRMMPMSVDRLYGIRSLQTPITPALPGITAAHTGGLPAMTLTRCSPRRVRSRLYLDFLEDRLLLSVLTGCSLAVVPAPATAVVQDASQSDCPQTDAVQAATTTGSAGPITCPVTGATITSADAVLTPTTTSQAVVFGQTAPTDSVTPITAAPILPPQFPLANPAILDGGELGAVEAAGPASVRPDAEPNYVTAAVLFVHCDEYDLSWLDNEATSDHERSTPTAPLAQFAQADEPNAKPSSPDKTYHLVPDFQPLDQTSPFLVATVRSVELQAPKPVRTSPADSRDNSAVEKTRNQSSDYASAPVDLKEETPTESRPLATSPLPVTELGTESPAADSGEEEGCALEWTWLQTAQVAVPVAGFILALGFCRTQSWAEEPESGRVSGDPLRARRE